RFSPRHHPQVAPFHAEVRFENCEYLLRAQTGDAPVFVNNREVSEILLQDGDVIEFGEGGPKVRFRVNPEDYGACRPFRQILEDSKALARQYQRGLLTRGTVFFKELARESALESFRRLRLALIPALVLLAVTAGLTVYLVSREARQRQEIVTLQGRVTAETAQRERVLREAAAERDRLARSLTVQKELQERRLTALQAENRRLEADLKAAMQNARAREGEVARLRRELAAGMARTRQLEEEREAPEQIIRQFAGGVGLIHVAVQFLEPGSRRPLRHMTPVSAEGSRSENVSPAGEGPPVTMTSLGTGFLLDARGWVATNEHVARPWRTLESVQPILAAGYIPEVIRLQVFFPGHPEPFPMAQMAVSDRADVALLRVDLRGRKVPVLSADPLSTRPQPGQPVVLIGYPLALQGLLAKAEAAVAREILEATSGDLENVIRGLARRGLIRPLSTQGHLTDVLPHQIVYDAQTTIGGSGGPLFNLQGRVIAVNQAVMASFGGSNFGVPIQEALDLLHAHAASARR
ncbi:MAG: trypsin-like peptidase domain-containing protein, partial [Deltaproteobacteria bacterium]|nr:trypsin-like peptidase domain-containing protein [Deltaproteobacteria bacterium]